MDRYELYLLAHIAAVTLWLGAGILLQIIGTRATSDKDDDGIRRVLETTAMLGTKFFIPASLAVLVFGLLMVFDGPWSFDQLWIVLGLAGYAATFGTGLFILKPGAERASAMIADAGGTLTPAARAEAQRLLTLGRLDYIVLYLVVADMVLKPTADDVWTLLVMAVILVAGVAWIVVQARAVEAGSRPTAAR